MLNSVNWNCILATLVSKVLQEIAQLSRQSASRITARVLRHAVIRQQLVSSCHSSVFGGDSHMSYALLIGFYILEATNTTLHLHRTTHQLSFSGAPFIAELNFTHFRRCTIRKLCSTYKSALVRPFCCPKPQKGWQIPDVVLVTATAAPDKPRLLFQCGLA